MQDQSHITRHTSLCPCVCRNSTVKPALAALILSATCAIYGSTLYAAPITFNFEGRVTSVTDRWGWTGGVQVGDLVSGSYTFESNVPDSYPDEPYRGEYANALHDLQFSAGPSAFAMLPDAPSSVGVHDALSEFSTDSYGLSGAISGPFGGNAGFSIVLASSRSDVLNSDSLLVVPPSLLDFDAMHQGSFLGTESSGLAVEFQLTSITPEPGTLVCLIGVAAWSLIAFRPGGRRSSRFATMCLVLVAVSGSRVFSQVAYREEIPTAGIPIEREPVNMAGPVCGCSDLVLLVDVSISMKGKDWDSH